MTEQEWISSADPAEMLRVLQESYAADVPLRPPSDRKLRLFACACCRLVWHKLTDERSRRAVEVAERYADGGASTQEYHDNWRDAWTAGIETLPVGHPSRAVSWLFGRTDSPGGIAAEVCAILQPIVPPAAQAALLREIVGNPWRPVEIERKERLTRAAPEVSSTAYTGVTRWHPPSWLTPTVIALARAAYGGRRRVVCPHCNGSGLDPDFRGHSLAAVGCKACHADGHATDGLLDPHRLAVLADALEDAGANDATLLGHLRSGGTHARGCWALDLILGKE